MSIFKHDIINFLITKYNFTKYLEIGVFNGDNIRKINASLKHGIDPGAEGIVAPEVTHRCSSNSFFDNIENNEIYDIIFIDGLHHANQVALDITNSFTRLSTKGFLVLHDCFPPDYDHQVVPRKQICWTGDVWRAMVGFRKNNQFVSCVIDTDLGVGVIKNNPDLSLKRFEPTSMSYEKFESNAKELLNLISYQEFLDMDI